ncbi:hypothetical protein [Limisalsivibrio acetivorans]|uniref:hypothetical protein n=1 Tax=Limisalsivibrio acetivorans TaxID=1304888 RepID=UPI0003B37187|nr:hypothetical protein [Limisalsivibrio acetivorans]
MRDIKKHAVLYGIAAVIAIYHFISVFPSFAEPEQKRPDLLDMNPPVVQKQGEKFTYEDYGTLWGIAKAPVEEEKTEEVVDKVSPAESFFLEKNGTRFRIASEIDESYYWELYGIADSRAGSFAIFSNPSPESRGFKAADEGEYLEKNLLIKRILGSRVFVEYTKDSSVWELKVLSTEVMR